MSDQSIALIATAFLTFLGSAGGIGVWLTYSTNKAAQRAAAIIAQAAIEAAKVSQAETRRIGDIERLEKRVAVLEARESEWIKKYASKEEIEELKATIDQMAKEIASLKVQLAESRSKEAPSKS